MTPRESAGFAVTSKSVAGLAIAFLVLAAFFGFLNGQKVKALRTNAANAQAARDAAERRQANANLNAPPGGTAGAEQRGKVDDAENRAATAEAELAQAQKEKADLQSQVDDLRRQLDSAEREKALLAEKIQGSQERSSQPKETKKRRETASTQRETVSPHRAGVHGTVLAYNQAYNFVVLNLGARNGVETNSEMLVLRDGTLIGKIRISS